MKIWFILLWLTKFNIWKTYRKYLFAQGKNKMDKTHLDDTRIERLNNRKSKFDILKSLPFKKEKSLQI